MRKVCELWAYVCKFFWYLDFRAGRLVVEDSAVHAPNNVVERHVHHVHHAEIASMLKRHPCDLILIHCRWESDGLS